MTRTPRSPRPFDPRRSSVRPVARRGRLLRAALAATAIGATGLLSGCTYTSDATAIKPYQAADGYSAQFRFGDGEVRLRNVLIVSAGQGKPGALIGALSYTGSAPVTLSITGIMGSRLTVRPGESTTLGSPEASPVFDAVTVPPGAHEQVEFETAEGARFSISVPVVPPRDYYSSLSPKTPTRSLPGTPEADATEDPEASPSPTS